MITEGNDQIWSQWRPAKLDLGGNYQTIKIMDEPNGFKILISKVDKAEIVEIIFNKSVWAYRRTSESFRQEIFKDLSLSYGDEFYINWSFFKIERSAYLCWLKLQSCYISDDLNLEHYVIMTLDDVIDVVANYQPQINIIKLTECNGA